MRSVRVQVAYDGSCFFGWQRQAGFGSVQAALEEALEALTSDRVTVYGAGRTDTGVHALRQVAHFHTDTPLSDERLFFALNAHLPEGAVVRALETCDESFHAQRDARGKRYLYTTLTTRLRPPFGRTFWHWVPDALDLAAMRRAAVHLVGEHDFTSLANAGSPRVSNVRRVDALHVLARRERVTFVVQGSGFLYNMVRTIAGTLIDVGRGRIAAEALPEILSARDRTLAGPTAPAAGLFLARVLYPEPVFVRPLNDRPAPGCFPG